jgi:phosphoenolpyruvate---glycerone phosphotransferase subunit DhaL
MTMPLTSHTLSEGLKRISACMEVVAGELNELDSRVGDGDLGVSMVLCARQVVHAAEDLPEDLGMAFMKCVHAVVKGSGASFPTLLASALMAIAKAVKGRTEVPWAEVTDLLRLAKEAMIARGKAALGDKTVIDAVEAARKATEGLDEPEELLEAAVTAVGQAIEEMKDKPNRVGRARIWADKSVGLADPGMVAFKRILEGLA